MIAPCSRPKAAVRSLAATALLTTVFSTSLFLSQNQSQRLLSQFSLQTRPNRTDRRLLISTWSSDNTDSLTDLEDQLARAPTDSDADDLRRYSQAQERRLRDEGPTRAPHLDEVAADEEVEDAARRYRHAEDGEPQRGASVDLGAVASLIRRSQKLRVVRVEDVAFHEAEYVEDSFFFIPDGVRRS